MRENDRAETIQHKRRLNLTTQTNTAGTNAREAGNQAKDSAYKVADQTKDAWSQVQDDKSPAGIMKFLEDMPATNYVYATVGSIGLSLVLRLLGRKDFATFVGLWPPTILALAMLNKQFRPSKEM